MSLGRHLLQHDHSLVLLLLVRVFPRPVAVRGLPVGGQRYVSSGM